jgi:hypothetical protein
MRKEKEEEKNSINCQKKTAHTGQRDSPTRLLIYFFASISSI